MRAAELGRADHAYLKNHVQLATVRELPGFAAIVERVAQNAAASPRK
jgi:hypothetical protein